MFGAWCQQAASRPGAEPAAAAAAAAASSAPAASISGDAPPPAPPFSSAKVHAHRRSTRDVAEARRVQVLSGHAGVVWVAKFSDDGRHLATAGQDACLRIWRATTANRKEKEDTIVEQPDTRSAGSSQGSGTSSAQDATSTSASLLFNSRPIRYEGHTEDILDVAWSNDKFILSASLDKTVRLWHLNESFCIRVFKHTDFVTCVRFHPLDTQRFVSGSIDGRLRLWNIPERKVLHAAHLHQDMVTAVCFLDAGSRVIVGTLRGRCRIYECEDARLEYVAQVDVRNMRGTTPKKKKVTGIEAVPGSYGDFLITSNDSRIRLYKGYAPECKYKGHKNQHTQIRSAISQDGKFVMCGSDDGWVYLWYTKPAAPDSGYTSKKNQVFERFEAQGTPVTMAIFAPDMFKQMKIVDPGGNPELGGGKISTSGSGTEPMHIVVTVGFGGDVQVFALYT